MAGILDKFKKDNKSSSPVSSASGNGSANVGSTTKRNVADVESARERAAAAKAQIEARKALEEMRRSVSGSSADNNSRSPFVPNNKNVTSSTPQHAPIKRPAALSINRAQAMLDEETAPQTESRVDSKVESGNVGAGVKSAASLAADRAKLELEQAKSRETRAVKEAELAAAKAEEARLAVTKSTEVREAALKSEKEASAAAKQAEKEYNEALTAAEKAQAAAKLADKAAREAAEKEAAEKESAGKA